MGHSHGPHPLREDKGFQAWYYMRENLGDYYRFTKKAAKVNLLFMGAIPLALGYYAYSTVGKYDVIAQRRSTPIYSEYVPRV